MLYQLVSDDRTKLRVTFLPLYPYSHRLLGQAVLAALVVLVVVLGVLAAVLGVLAAVLGVLAAVLGVAAAAVVVVVTRSSSTPHNWISWQRWASSTGKPISKVSFKGIRVRG